MADTSRKDLLKLAILASAVFLVYQVFKGQRAGVEDFVASNSFTVPAVDPTDKPGFAESNDRLVQLIKAVNGTSWSMPYSLGGLPEVLDDIIGNVGLGNIKVASIGRAGSFTLYDVVIADLETAFPVKFDRVDFVVNSLNPFIIERVVLGEPLMTYGPAGTVGHVAGFDELAPKDLFRIKNKLGLFYPYPTSQNDMAFGPGAVEEHMRIVREKEKEAQLMRETTAPGAQAPQALM